MERPIQYPAPRHGATQECRGVCEITASMYSWNTCMIARQVRLSTPRHAATQECWVFLRNHGEHLVLKQGHDWKAYKFAGPPTHKNSTMPRCLTKEMWLIYSRKLHDWKAYKFGSPSTHSISTELRCLSKELRLIYSWKGCMIEGHISLWALRHAATQECSDASEITASI